MSSVLQKFITTCTLTFKAFQHDVTMSKGKANLWNFVTKDSKNNRLYCIYCAPDIKKVKSLIKIAIKKLPKDHRLVVVCTKYEDVDQTKANETGYTIVTLEEINRFGQEMLEIREAESKGGQVEASAEENQEEVEDVISASIAKEKLF